MTKQRAFLLDLFRIILCIGVVVYHYTPDRPSSGPFMVNGFLVMSGFLVGIMFRSRPVFDVPRFYSNKAKRLLPMFFAALLLGVVWKLYLNEIVPPWKISEWGNFSLVKWLMYYNTPLWYMGVEFVMLLLVPVLYCLSRTKWGVSFVALASILITCSLFSKVPDNSPFGEGLYFSPVARCWQFVLGVLVAGMCDRMYKWNVTCRTVFKSITYCLLAVFIGLGGVLAVVKQGSTLNYWNYSFSFDLLTSAFFAVLIPCLYVSVVEVSQIWRKLVEILSGLTYPVFLIHVPLLAISVHGIGFCFGQLPYWVSAITASVLSIAASLVMLKVESWCMKRHSGKIQ